MAEVKVLGVRDENQNNVAAGGVPAMTVLVKNNPPKKKKKEKLSALCKTPPSLIRNNEGHGYRRGDLLGEGGFARCFQVKNDQGQIYAAKTVAKASLTATKTRTKLVTEIEIHKSLKHKAIVEFIDCFEDNLNVYILLEMCSNQSLFDMVRRRKVLTVPEVKFYTMQVLAGVKFMHDSNVIHRDLKLGNIFLDHRMNLKIGDFGLASQLKSPTDRRKTICGTPNYIAPEILFRKEAGHSFEVDIWSVGIIVYAMIYGKPPFQCKEVPEIYERIKKLDYSFPRDSYQAADDLIDGILQIDPEARLSIDEITRHAFFRRREPFPSSIPKSALISKPDFDISPETSSDNFRKAREYVLGSHRQSDGHPSAAFNRNAQVSAKFKVMVENARADGGENNKDHILPESISPASTKEKYRMVMVPKGVSGVKEKILVTSDEEEEQTKQEPAEVQFGEKSPVTQGPKGAITKKNLAYAAGSAVPSSTTTSGYPSLPDMDKTLLSKNCNRLLALADSINAERRKSYTNEQQNSNSSEKMDNPVCVAKWVDFSQKEGLAYQLSNGQAGVLSFWGFTTAYDPEKHEYWRYSGYDLDPTDFTITKLTDRLRKEKYNNEIRMLKAYYNYMTRNLCQSHNSSAFNQDKPVVVRRHMRQDSYVIFELSNGSFQFNFPDHCKLVISPSGKSLTMMDPDRKTQTWSLYEVFRACRPESDNSDLSRFVRRNKISQKIDYCEQKLKRLWTRDSTPLASSC